MADKDIPHRISASQLFEETAKRPVIPCCLSSDIGLGGGIPTGSTVVVGGKAKSGKTSFCLQNAANAQNLYGSKVFFYNLEGRLTKLVFGQVRGLKTDIENFEIVQPPAICDRAGNVIGHKKWSTEQWLENIGETIINNPKCIIIIDSIAYFSSEKEQSESMGYSDRGKSKTLESQFCRKYGEFIIPNQVTLFLITHVIANTSGYGAPFQMKLGSAFRYQADIILVCKSVEKWNEQDGRILGHDIKYNVEASALGPPNLDITIPLRYGYGIDDLKDIVTHSINWSIIQKKGAWYTLPFYENKDKLIYKEVSDTDDVKFVKFQGENSIRNLVGNNKEVRDKLYSLIKEKVFG
jgi:RecA/RadA recombinase